MSMNIVITKDEPKEPNEVHIAQLNNIELSVIDELNLQNCADYIPEQNRVQLLMAAAQKLRYGGKLIVHGLDLVAISELIYNGMTNLATVNNMIYDKDRKSAGSMHSVANILRVNCGLRVIQQRIDKMFYYIEAERPNAKR